MRGARDLVPGCGLVYPLFYMRLSFLLVLWLCGAGNCLLYLKYGMI